jgi:hypothetical protein
LEIRSPATRITGGKEKKERGRDEMSREKTQERRRKGAGKEAGNKRTRKEKEGATHVGRLELQ